MSLVFKCLKCSSCCVFKSDVDYPRVFPWEKRFLEEKAISYGFDKPVFKPDIVYLDPVRGVYVVVLYKWVINGKCLFNKDGKCIIHGEHPLACRMYPLIVNYSDKTLRVSLLCNWVRENKEFIERGIDPSRVFNNELKYAVKAFTYISLMIESLEKTGFMKVDPSEIDTSREIIDYDMYVQENQEN